MEIKTFYAKKFPENCYAITLNNEIILVDPGEMTEELYEFVSNNAKNIKYVLITHKHIDHIGAVSKIKKISPNAQIVIHKLDADGLADPIKSLAIYLGIEQEKTSADILCEDNDVINIGDEKITIFHTPGHSVGGVCYIINNVIFTGDTLFEDSCGRTDFPDGNEFALSESLKKLKNLDGDYTLFPGHGNPTTLSRERVYNPYMRNL